MTESPPFALIFRYRVVPVLVLVLTAAACSDRSKLTQSDPFPCSQTGYGLGVTRVGGTGGGGADANITSRTVAYTPTGGHALIAAAYTCADSGCQTIPATTLTISDNINNPESCFVASPHSPFSLIETSAGTQKLQEYIWMCPTIPPGVNSFTVTCSVSNACSYITLTLTEWTGLATTNVFDTDGGAASSIQQTTATISTSSATRYSNDLLYTFMDNTGDETMTPGPPYCTALQFFPGNINTAVVVGGTGIQTATASWTGNDDWYGAIAAIKTSASQPAMAGR